MGKQYVIGVDGGNTKTDYFLFDTNGMFISHLRAGTCSHEKLPDRYEGAYRIMKENIDKLLEKHNLTIESVKSGVFGLAGLDIPIQKENLQRVVKRIGFKSFVVENDGYLGLKAGSVSGCGICSINGTGTVTIGIDLKGNRLQVGGVGYIAGDDAGGAFMTRRLFREVHNTLYRCGEETSLVKPVLSLLGITDKRYYIEAISELYSTTFSHLPYIQLVFEHALRKDKVALKIIDKIAHELAKSTAGCINNLAFDKEDEVEVVLAGSVWTKPNTTLLIDCYKAYVEQLTTFKCHYICLEVPPGIGAILWALELANHQPVGISLRSEIIHHMKELYRD